MRSLILTVSRHKLTYVFFLSFIVFFTAWLIYNKPGNNSINNNIFLVSRFTSENVNEQQIARFSLMPVEDIVFPEAPKSQIFKDNPILNESRMTILDDSTLINRFDNITLINSQANNEQQDSCVFIPSSSQISERISKNQIEILIVDNPIWRETNQNACQKAQWQMIVDKFDIGLDAVISSNGSGYVNLNNGSGKLNFSDNYVKQYELTVTRIATLNNELIVSPITIGFSDTKFSNFEGPIYDVTVDQNQLRQLYRQAPFYNLGTIWQKKIESSQSLQEIQQPIEGQLHGNFGGEAIKLSIRGNVGNHWEGVQKSWDIDFIDSENRQIKLVIPSDRGYLNQMFVEYISQSLKVPTPNVRPAKLIINGVDHGVYLQYEDFDKIFIELHQFNSDAVPSKNYFRDHFDAYPVTNSLANIDGDKGNNSYQQNISQSHNINTENFDDYFEVDNYARWLAIQIITGDKHQNLSDNFRFFIDRTTGRYVMINWDSSLIPINKEQPYIDTIFTNIFMSKPTRKELTYRYVTQFYSESDKHKTYLEDLISQYLKDFEDDPQRTVSADVIRRSADNLRSTLNSNLQELRDD